MRAKPFVSEFGDHTDFISDMTFYEAESCLLAVSGDGSLSINDLKSQKASVQEHIFTNRMYNILHSTWQCYSRGQS